MGVVVGVGVGESAREAQGCTGKDPRLRGSAFGLRGEASRRPGYGAEGAGCDTRGVFRFGGAV